MAERKVPRIRFKGFEEDWEQRKLGEIFEESNERSSEMDILSVSVSNGIYPASESDRDVNPGASLENYKIVHKGDIVYNSMRMWQGAVGESVYDGIVSPAYVVVRAKQEVDSRYFGYLLKRPEMLYKYLCYSQGNSKDTQTLRYERFAEIEARISIEVTEQQMISRCIGKIDSLLSLHQRKLEKLKILKKAMLEKLFPKNGAKVPEIRFSGFTDDWEQRKLDEMASFSKGIGYSKADLRESGTPVILYGRLYTRYETSISVVDTFVGAKQGTVSSRGGEVIVPASGETAEEISIASVVGKPGILLGGDLNIIIPSKDLNSAFLAISISHARPHDKLTKMAQGKSVVHLHNTDLRQVEIDLPSYEEQQGISNLFETLDSLLSLHQRKLEKLRQIKKSMLERMFV